MKTQGTTQTVERSEKNNRAHLLNFQKEHQKFLLAGGATIAGLSLKALAEPQQEIKEFDKRLFAQLALFDQDEKKHLADLLMEFKRRGWLFGAWTVAMFLKEMDAMQLCLDYAEKQHKVKEEEHQYRDNLPRDERIKFVLSKLEDRDLGSGCYMWNVQDQVLRMVRDGTPTPDVTWAGTLDYCAKSVRERFEGCDRAFRTEVIDRYLQDILPGKRAEQEEEEAGQNATEKLLEAISDKTPAEIDALAEEIAASA